MRRLLPLLSLLALALWLPASQHCALEQAGVFATTCKDHGTARSPADKDGCSAFEDAAYKPTSSGLKIPAPSLLACACFLCLQASRLQMFPERVELPVESFQQAESRVATWHFVRRAAPLPGAPSLLLA
jgi:hypothetical protein